MQSAATSKITNAKMKFAIGPATTIESRWSGVLPWKLSSTLTGTGAAGAATPVTGRSSTATPPVPVEATAPAF